MDIKKSALVAVAAMTLSVGAAQAATTTYNFAQATPDSGNFSLGCDAGGILNFAGCSVTHTSAGYGVNGSPDKQPNQIDSIPGYETLIVTFDWAVKLVDFTLGQFGGKDDYDYQINGGAWNVLQTANPAQIGQNYVTSFAVRATRTGGFFAGDVANDAFTLAGMTVAPVPVPAAGILLLTALGGLGIAARRRKA
jgi:hypothetical protein